ncbi:MAG: hypothetical protein ACE1Z4_13170 [Gammaproteobacteria bacterium]|nr:hypothetical protein [Gammaproteobacteria bacterium]
MGKPAVWFVDDLSSNRKRFRDNHQDAFIVTTFREPAEVMDELEQMGPPDALLCDIYFYESEEQAKRIEEQIGNAAARLRALAGDLGAGNKDAQAGIRLIEDVTNYFKGDPPFPLYAYTSKGPYILDDSGFDRLVQSSARWLFKGRNTPEAERRVISRDIKALKMLRLQEGIRKHLWAMIFISAIIGWCAGKFL